MRTHIISVSLVALAALLWADSASDAQRRKVESLVAVVHGTNSESRLSKSELKNIYLGRKTRWPDGDPVEAYMRPARSGAGFAFMRTILKMTPAKFSYHWQGRQLSGRGTAPATVSRTKRLVSLVSRDRGAIGYVTKSEARRLRAYVNADRIRLIAID